MIETDPSGRDTFPAAPVAIIERHGVSYEILLPNAAQDHIQKRILASATPYELDMLEDMRRRIAENDLVVDVGANIGNHALYLACVAKARVVAFEPNGALCSAFRESISRNGLAERITVRAQGVGRVRAIARFEKAISRNLGAQRLLVGEGDLEIVPLDSIRFDGKVKAIKIDVEGMELDVLEGAAALIARDRPLVYVESHDETGFRELAAWAEANGYVYWETFNYTPTHLLIPSESVGVEQHIAHLGLNAAIQEYRALIKVRNSRDAEVDARTAAQRLKAELEIEHAARTAAEAELERTRKELERTQTKLMDLEAMQRALSPYDRQNRFARHDAETARVISALQADYGALRAEAAQREWWARRLEGEVRTLRAYGRELEDRYLAVLESETWKVMEPVRRVLRRIRNRPAAQPFVPRLSRGGDLAARRKPKRYALTPRPGEFGVDDSVEKLWGGFSSPACRDLERLAEDVERATPDRVAAALNLARWFALSGDWKACLSNMETIAELDRASFQLLESRLLLIEANVRVGHYRKALEYVYEGPGPARNGNVACAFSNMLLHRSKSTQSDGQRLEVLNDVYRSKDLAPLELIDPERGLEFGNVRGEAAPVESDGPKISVLVPLRNAAAVLETTIESLFSQTRRQIEIIAVDDASTDDTWQKLRVLAARDDRLRIFRNEEMLGAYPALNRALALSTGDLITVLTAGDWAHPQMLDVQARELSASGARGTFSAAAHVSSKMAFGLCAQGDTRPTLAYVHRRYSSLMLRRSDLALLHQWDGVLEYGDEELAQRASAIWGEAALHDVMPTTPLCFSLRVDPWANKRDEARAAAPWNDGRRREYLKQAVLWRSSSVWSADGLSIERVDRKTPFPVPRGLAPKALRGGRTYDIVIVSDLSLLGGTRRCNEGYVKAATKLGLRVGLFHWPRYDLMRTEVAEEYRRMSYQANVDILVPEDDVEAHTVLIHHPPILKYPLDAVPRIEAEQVAILVNQLPMQLRDTPPHYYFPDDVDVLCVELFGVRPVWIPISPLTRRLLQETSQRIQLHDEDWFPPLSKRLPMDGPPARSDVGARRGVVLGRHSRDHWTKWPGTADGIRAAYCADADIEVRLLGGARTPRRLLGGVPANWQVLPFDALPVDDFLADIDVFLHFVHDDYIEEFGRNVAEAMAHGIPVLLPESFRETFGSAAVYCQPEEVESVVRRLWSSRSGYVERAARGYQFVLKKCDQRIVEERLASFVRRKVRAMV